MSFSLFLDLGNHHHPFWLYGRPSLFAGLVFAVLTIHGLKKPQITKENCHFKIAVLVFTVEDFLGM